MWAGPQSTIKKFALGAGNQSRHKLDKYRSVDAVRRVTDAHRIGCRGVAGLAQAHLETAYPGSCYFSTTSGNITDDVILPYLQEHEPTGVSRWLFSYERIALIARFP
jgi:hypothetical protein